MKLKLQFTVQDRCIPIFDINKIPYYRKERDGFTSFMIPHGQLEYEIFNRSTMYILSLMDGKHTLNDIYVHLIEKHGKESMQRL